jgi:glycerophosphoryl diester phosphodiesterase
MTNSTEPQNEARSFSWNSSAPLVIAHRGASGHAPENTLAAFRRARELGAEGVELDVRLCASGEVVVFHDEDLRRVARREASAEQLNLRELQRLDVGGWFGAAFEGERVPTLEEVFAAIPGMLVNVEIKAEVLSHPRRLCAAVAEIVRSQPAGRVVVSSFHPCALWEYRRFDRETPLGYLHHAEQGFPLRKAWPAAWLGVSAMHPDKRLLTAGYAERAHRKGLRVNTWTVNESDEIRAALAAGADAVITNYPDRARTILDA